jgi:hypothetical protein
MDLSNGRNLHWPVHLESDNHRRLSEGGMMRNILILAWLLVSPPAWSIDFKAVISDFEGMPVTECADQPPPRDDRECQNRRPVTLAMAAMRALLVTYDDERGIAAEEKFKRGELARKIYESTSGNGEPVLTVEEMATVKKLIGKGYPPLMVTQIWRMLDPAAK